MRGRKRSGEPPRPNEADLAQILGYLNFSTKEIDRTTLAALNRLYGQALPGSPFEGMPAWLQIQQWLQEALIRLHQESSAFRDCVQAEQLIELVWLHLLPSYLDFHRDLLFHQEPEAVFNGFFLGKAMEAVVLQGPEWHEKDRVVEGAIAHLNDFVGYRPVAVLEGRRLEPYPHEWVHPIPVYLQGVGVSEGVYKEIICQALEILRNTPEDILQRAGFDLDQLQELAIDPRAYDFDHPVNERPNYHFGQWDPHRVDNRGLYTRFVIRQVTIDGLLARIDAESSLPRDQLLFEAAAVLAGTMLMASGITGRGPGAYASTVGLADLMGPIASYRDEFYEYLIQQVSGDHGDRLRKEQRIRKQPFGGARQHLNTYLAKQRAAQLEHVQLARLFARMGNAAAAKEQSDFVQAPSARIISRIDCLMTAAHQMLEKGRLKEATGITPQILDLLRRGIECGAIVDPWNILGFAGMFPRYEGTDSPIPDHRIDDLVYLMEALFALQSRIWREAAAIGDQTVCSTIERELRDTADWWRQFAAHEIRNVQATDPLETVESAELVAKALRLWHAGGAAVGDVRFWAPHAELFASPKAYALVIEALLERHDFVASMALLVHWLSQVERVGLEKGDAAFPRLALRWMRQLDAFLRNRAPTDQCDWGLALKFFDYLEANAGPYLEPPEFRWTKPSAAEGGLLDEDGLRDEQVDEWHERFDSAYEDVIYKDSTDDGIDSELSPEQDELEPTELMVEADRLMTHLSFLTALAEMWKTAALSPQVRKQLVSEARPSHDKENEPVVAPPAQFTHAAKEGEGRIAAAFESWAQQAAKNQEALVALMQQVANYRIPKTRADHESMSQYDRHRLIKESLLDKIIDTIVETADARRLLLANLYVLDGGPDVQVEMESLAEDDRLAVSIAGALLHERTALVESLFPRLLEALRPKKLLYIPLARGGDPHMIYRVRIRRRMLSHLLQWMPRQGFLLQACQLIETARYMEHHNPVGPGAVTEFDELFQLCFRSLVQSIIQNAILWKRQSLGTKDELTAEQFNEREAAAAVAAPESEASDVTEQEGTSLGDAEPDSDDLINLLEELNELMLFTWLSHSRTLRLSVLESIDSEASWEKLVQFIRQFGGPLLTQSFLRLGNVRAILHQGVGHWLDQMAEEGREDEIGLLLDAIETGHIKRSEAETMLTIIFEAVIDHYSEYRDYNSTTTQSDRGEYFHMFLDFLRLRVRYERVSWNLKPIYWTHEVLVRSGCHQNAQQWRRALADRIGRESDLYIQRLQELQEKYAMRMPTVADRLHERFVQPMTVDRMRALVGPAIREYHETGKSPSFDMLIEECKLMMEQPTGVGLDIPAWLSALETEVERVLEKMQGFYTRPRYENAVAFRPVTAGEIAAQLESALKARKLDSNGLAEH